jgi:hypothetical protein
VRVERERALEKLRGSRIAYLPSCVLVIDLITRSYLSAASIPQGLKTLSPDNPPSRQVSSDANLTALVQLGALRLDTDRAFLSLIDGSFQYIAAEATRNHSILKADETMYLGLTKLELSFGVCPRSVPHLTITAFTLKRKALNCHGGIWSVQIHVVLLNLITSLEDFYQD